MFAVVNAKTGERLPNNKTNSIDLCPMTIEASPIRPLLFFQLFIENRTHQGKYQAKQ